MTGRMDGGRSGVGARGGLAAATALACALGAGPAMAAAGSNATAAVVGHTQFADGSPNEFVAQFQTQAGGPGATNAVQLNVSGSHPQSSTFAFSQPDAGYVGPADAQGSAMFHVASSIEALASHAGEPVSLVSLSSLSASDTLTLLGRPSDMGRNVVFHAELEVFSNGGGVGAAAFLQQFGVDSGFDVTGVSQLRVSGDGIGPSSFGGDLFSETDFHATQDHESRAVLGAPTFIPVDLTMQLGVARDFGLDMSLTETLNMADNAGDLEARFLLQDGASLFWAGGGHVTDAATGQELCGLTAISASGVDYGAGAACPGGGSGWPGAIPEPAAWALMIVGIGLSGAMLRSRRRSLA